MKCSKCLKEKDESEFFIRNKEKNIRHKSCKDCYKSTREKTYKDHYKNNKDIYKKRTKERKERLIVENRSKMIEYLSTRPCVDCGEDDIVVLEFDHIDDKNYGISTMLSDYDWSKILEEIGKCEVVCCNCHRRRTAKRGKWYRAMEGTRTPIDGDLQSPV